MFDSIKDLKEKVERFLKKTDTENYHLVIGKYVYARQYVFQKWNNGILFYFAVSKTCFPPNPNIFIYEKKKITYSKLLEIVKDYADFIAVEKELFFQIIPFAEIPCKELIIVAEDDYQSIKELLPLKAIHRIKVREKVVYF